MTERLYTLKEAHKIAENIIKDHYDSPEIKEANRIATQRMEELMQEEVKRRVKEQLEPQREAFANQTDKLAISYNEVVKVIGCIKGTHDALLQRLDAFEQTGENSNKVYDTLTSLVANVSGFTGTLDKIITLLERKSKTDRKMIS